MRWKLIPAGTAVPPIRGTDLSHKQVSVDYKGLKERTLLLVMSPICGVCMANWSNWEQIASNVDTKKTRAYLLNVSNANLGPFLLTHTVPKIGILAHVEAETIPFYRFFTTPQTLIIGTSGRVERVWAGALASGDVREIIDYLHGK
jgi:hypothetical protein